MSNEIELVPSHIRFMSDRINRKFSNGVFVYYIIDKIEKGEVDVYDLPKIRVVCKDGFYYAFNNRRLYVYRVLHLRGKLDKVKVKLAPLTCFQQERFTTKNNGEYVRLQRGRTLPHSKPKSSSLLNDFDKYVYDDQNDYGKRNYDEDGDDNDCGKNKNDENNINNNEENSFVDDDDDEGNCSGVDYHEKSIYADDDDDEEENSCGDVDDNNDEKSFVHDDGQGSSGNEEYNEERDYNEESIYGDDDANEENSFDNDVDESNCSGIGYNEEKDYHKESIYDKDDNKESICDNDDNKEEFTGGDGDIHKLVDSVLSFFILLLCYFMFIYLFIMIEKILIL